MRAQDVKRDFELYLMGQIHMIIRKYNIINLHIIFLSCSLVSFDAVSEDVIVNQLYISYSSFLCPFLHIFIHAFLQFVYSFIYLFVYLFIHSFILFIYFNILFIFSSAVSFDAVSEDVIVNQLYISGTYVVKPEVVNQRGLFMAKFSWEE